MKNLAGVQESSRLAAEELFRAGVPIVPATGPDGEVEAQVEGALRAGPYSFRFVRRWAYWSAKATPPLPAAIAVSLNDAPGPGGGTKYSGGGSNLGAVARAHGFAGGMDSKTVREWGECEVWHIDTPEGLAVFAAWCRENLA